MPKVSAEHSEQRRLQVLHAALRCFEREGFHRTSMADVIAESGLSAGSVYRYYRSKDDLIHAVAQVVLGQLDRVLEEVLADDAAPDPAEVVRRTLTTALSLGGTLGVDPTRVALSVWTETLRDEALREHLAGVYRRTRVRFAQAVRSAQARGAVGPGADPDEVASAVLGAVMGFVVQRLLLRDVEVDSYARGLAALAAGPGSSPAGR